MTEPLTFCSPSACLAIEELNGRYACLKGDDLTRPEALGRARGNLVANMMGVIEKEHSVNWMSCFAIKGRLENYGARVDETGVEKDG